jgi:hypothetical protein
MRGQQPIQIVQATAIKDVTATAQNKMYIELTTFAIPTFLIAIFKALAIAAGVWLAVCIIVGLFYPSN